MSNRIKYISIIIGLLVISMLLINKNKSKLFVDSYDLREFDDYKSYIDKSNISDRKYINDEHSYQEFTGDYNIHNLESETGYIIDNEFCLNFYFNKDAIRADVDSAKSVYSNMFFGNIKYSYIPYIDAVINKSSFDDIVLRIFIDDKLVIYKKYDFHNLDEVYYENIDFVVRSREVDNAIVSNFEDAVISLIDRNSIIEIQKPFKPFLYHFKIISKDVLADDKINKIKGFIEENIAPALESESKEIFGMNTNSLGIVIVFETLEGEYLRTMYFNGEKKEWINEDWMKLDLFLMNERM